MLFSSLLVSGFEPAIEFANSPSVEPVIDAIFPGAAIVGKDLLEGMGDDDIGLVEVVMPHMTQGGHCLGGERKTVRIHKSVVCSSIVAKHTQGIAVIVAQVLIMFTHHFS